MPNENTFYTTASGVSGISFAGAVTPPYSDMDIRRIYAELAELNNDEGTIESLNSYRTQSLTKKPKAKSKLYRNILRNSIDNKKYIDNQWTNVKDCQKFFRTAVESCGQFTSHELYDFAKLFNTRIFSDKKNTANILVFSVLDNFLQQEDCFDVFDLYYTKAQNFLIETGFGISKKELDVLIENGTYKKYMRFLDIIKGYLIKTKNYDRNSKSVRNIRDTYRL